MKKFIIVILLLAVCGALVYFGYPEISKLINGEQTATSSEADTASDISSADNSSKAQTSNVSAEEKCNKYCRSFVHNKILLYPIILKYNRIYSTSQRCNTNTFYHTHVYLSIEWRITVEIWRKTA